jgi:hypothetical protein
MTKQERKLYLNAINWIADILYPGEKGSLDMATLSNLNVVHLLCEMFNLTHTEVAFDIVKERVQGGYLVEYGQVYEWRSEYAQTRIRQKQEAEQRAGKNPEKGA